MRVKLQFGGEADRLQEHQFLSFAVPRGGPQLVELAGMDTDILMLGQGKVLPRKRIDHKAIFKRRCFVCKWTLLDQVLRKVLIEFVHTLLISCEANVLLQNAVSEINPDHWMNTCFLSRTDKRKYRSTAVDVCEG